MHMPPVLTIVIIAALWTGLLICAFYWFYKRRSAPNTAALTALANIHDGVLVFDLNNTLVDMNSAAREILHYKREPITGRLVIMPRTSWGVELAQFLDSGQTEINLEIEGRYYELTLSPLTNRRQVETGRIIVVHDVTESRMAADSARAAEHIAEARASELASLKNLAEILNQTLPPQRALEAGLEMVAEQMGAESGWLLTLTTDQKADLAAGFQLSKNMELAKHSDRPWALCACLKSLTIGELESPTRFECERLARTPGMSADQKFHLSIPVRASGVSVGILNLVLPRDRQLNDTETRLLAALGDQFGGAIERVRLFREVHKLAITDPLTGLFNRRHFYALAVTEIERSRRYQHPLSLAIVDIDHFKQINDTYGHLAGDRALQEVADACLKTLRRVDLVSRFGGEEMLFLMPETSQGHAVQAMERLRQAVEKLQITTPRGTASITVSIGMASLLDSGPIDFEVLLDRADQALYRAKNNGRNQVAIWEDSTTELE